MTAIGSQGTWEQYQIHVLAELKRLNEEISKNTEAIQKVSEGVLSLKIRATVWGAVAGSLVTLLPVAVKLILSMTNAGGVTVTK